MNATFFEDVAIELAAFEQRLEIELQLANLHRQQRLSRKIGREAAPAENGANVFPGDAPVVFKSEPSSALPTDTRASLAPQQPEPTREAFIPAASRVASLSEHNTFPKGRW